MKYGDLSHEQARFFRDQGYFRLLDCFEDGELDEIRDFVNREISTIKCATDTPNSKLYNLYDREPDLMNRVIGNQAIVGALISILGPNIVFIKNRHNHATANDHIGVPSEGIHRDILQPTRGLVTAVVYLQDSTIENGATKIIPGSHNFPYVGVPQEKGGGTWMSKHNEFSGLEDQAVPVPMKSGDTLLFNSTLFHGVGQNTSGDSRMSITLGYRSVDELDAQPDADRQIVVSGEYIYRGNDL